MFGTKTIATKLVRRARAISIEFSKMGTGLIAKDPVLANRHLAVATVLDVLAKLVQEVFELGEVGPDPEPSGRR